MHRHTGIASLSHTTRIVLIPASSTFINHYRASNNTNQQTAPPTYTEGERPKPMNSIEKALNDNSSRHCIVDLYNCSKHKLHSMKTYMVSEQCLSTPVGEILPSKSCLNLFTKIFGFCGAESVIMYSIGKTNQCIAIAFSVPFNRVFFDNWYALGIVSQDTAADGKLVEMLSSGSQNA